MPEQLRVLMIGAGGISDAAARIAVERDFFDASVAADYDVGRARSERSPPHGNVDPAT